MLYQHGPMNGLDAREAWGMRRTILVLTALAVCGMMVAPMGMAGKPQPPSPPAEKWGNIILDQNHKQMATTYNGGDASNPDRYVRLYDWDDSAGQFKHQWSAIGYDGCVLGDVDNDGSKELACSSMTVTTEGKGNNQIMTKKVFLHIWENGDHSNSSKLKILLPSTTSPPDKMAIGDVDGDGLKELVILKGWVEVWDFTNTNGKVDSTTTGPTNVIYDQSSFNQKDVGVYALDVADSDNDGVAEILVGMASGGNPTRRAAVIDYVGRYPNGEFRIVAYIGSAVVDDFTVANLDGDANNINEIFMSGPSGKVFIWRYENGQYAQKWIADINMNGYNSPVFYLQANDAADIDKDGSLEIISGASLGYKGQFRDNDWYWRMYLWEYSGNDKWTEYDIELAGRHGGAIDTMAHADFNGDGFQDVVYDGHLFKFGGKDQSGNPIMSCVQELPFAGANPALEVG